MKEFKTTIYSVTEALPAEGPLEGELKGYTGKCLEEYAGQRVACRYINEYGYEGWSIGTFGEEDLWFELETDAVIESVTHWMILPDDNDPMFEEAL